MNKLLGKVSLLSAIRERRGSVTLPTGCAPGCILGEYILKKEVTQEILRNDLILSEVMEN